MNTHVRALAARKVATIDLGAFTKQTKGGGPYQKVDESQDHRLIPMLSND